MFDYTVTYILPLIAAYFKTQRYAKIDYVEVRHLLSL